MARPTYDLTSVFLGPILLLLLLLLVIPVSFIPCSAFLPFTSGVCSFVRAVSCCCGQPLLRICCCRRVRAGPQKQGACLRTEQGTAGEPWPREPRQGEGSSMMSLLSVKALDTLMFLVVSLLDVWFQICSTVPAPGSILFLIRSCASGVLLYLLCDSAVPGLLCPIFLHFCHAVPCHTIRGTAAAFHHARRRRDEAQGFRPEDPVLPPLKKQSEAANRRTKKNSIKKYDARLGGPAGRRQLLQYLPQVRLGTVRLGGGRLCFKMAVDCSVAPFGGGPGGVYNGGDRSLEYWPSDHRLSIGHRPSSICAHSAGGFLEVLAGGGHHPRIFALLINNHRVFARQRGRSR